VKGILFVSAWLRYDKTRGLVTTGEEGSVNEWFGLFPFFHFLLFSLLAGLSCGTHELNHDSSSESFAAIWGWQLASKWSVSKILPSPPPSARVRFID